MPVIQGSVESIPLGANFTNSWIAIFNLKSLASTYTFSAQNNASLAAFTGISSATLNYTNIVQLMPGMQGYFGSIGAGEFEVTFETLAVDKTSIEGAISAGPSAKQNIFGSGTWSTTED